jgi:DNA-directed RNA polymerase subunit RPC12/RpoP
VTRLVLRSPIRCPACSLYDLEMAGHQRQARCSRCGFSLDGQMLKTLLTILSLPVALGRHACEESEHPQMVLLQGGVFHCPACRSEVVLLERDEALL